MTITGTSTPVTQTPAAPITPVVGDQAPQTPPVAPVAPPAAPQTPPAVTPPVTPPTQDVPPQTPPVTPPPAPTDQTPPPAQPDPLDAVYTPQHPDPVVQAVEGMLHEKGLTIKQVQEVFEKSVQSGNLEDIDQAKLKEYLGESGAKLAMQSLTQYNQKVQAEQKKMHDTAVHLLGGEPQFEAFKTWVHEPPATVRDVVAEYAEAVNAGGHLGYLALDALKNLYHQHAGVPTGTSSIVNPDLPANAGATLTPFKDRREYVNAMKVAQDSKDQAAIDLVTRRFMVKPV